LRSDSRTQLSAYITASIRMLPGNIDSMLVNTKTAKIVLPSTRYLFRMTDSSLLRVRGAQRTERFRCSCRGSHSQTLKRFRPADIVSPFTNQRTTGCHLYIISPGQTAEMILSVSQHGRSLAFLYSFSPTWVIRPRFGLKARPPTGKENWVIASRHRLLRRRDVS
jgi:hypothetical protein